MEKIRIGKIWTASLYHIPNLFFCTFEYDDNKIFNVTVKNGKKQKERIQI